MTTALILLLRSLELLPIILIRLNYLLPTYTVAIITVLLLLLLYNELSLWSWPSKQITYRNTYTCTHPNLSTVSVISSPSINTHATHTLVTHISLSWVHVLKTFHTVLFTDILFYVCINQNSKKNKVPSLLHGLCYLTVYATAMNQKCNMLEIQMHKMKLKQFQQRNTKHTCSLYILSHQHHTFCSVLPHPGKDSFCMHNPSLQICPRRTSDHVAAGRKLSASMRTRIPLWRWGLESKVAGKVTPSWDGLQTTLWLEEKKRHVVPYKDVLGSFIKEWT